MTHYTPTMIMDMGEQLGDGYSKTVLTLKEGDTAFAAISTKYHWQGPGTVTYLMHAVGWTVTPEGVTRKHVERD